MRGATGRVVTPAAPRATLEPMSSKGHPLSSPGPFFADQLKSGDPYELSNGHAILAPPTGQRGGKGNLRGGRVLDTDPDVTSAGIDVGFSTDPKHLRAPDISVGNVGDGPGWATSAPPLAVEYADVGQDEAALQAKIGELFAAGTRYLWVVRLANDRHVEVHEPGKPMRVRRSGETLTAPGVLRNPVAVEAMWDAGAADAATLRNLLNRAGYTDIDAIRHEGVEQGIERGIEQGIEAARATLLQLAEGRGLALRDEDRARIRSEQSIPTLMRWAMRVASAAAPADLFVP
jgi:hypothetical protein